MQTRNQIAKVKADPVSDAVQWALHDNGFIHDEKGYQRHVERAKELGVSSALLHLVLTRKPKA